MISLPTLTLDMASVAQLTCDQVLVLVDVKLHSAQTLRGVCVDVLHVLDLFKSFVHLQDTENKVDVKTGTKSAMM